MHYTDIAVFVLGYFFGLTYVGDEGLFQILAIN